MHIIASIQQFVLGSSWLFSGITNALVILVLGRLLLYGYREHSYLYQIEDRSKALDTWTHALIPVVRRAKLKRYRAIVTRNIGRVGNRRGWDSDHFLAHQLLYAGSTTIIVYLLLVMLLGLPFLLAPVAGFLVAALIFMSLSDQAGRRFSSCNRDLPYFIDYLTLAMGAGLDFNQGLATVTADAPKSPLADEFNIVLRNMRLGMSRADALLEMERRLDSPTLKLFVQTLVQAMVLGSDVSVTLKAMSETLQQKRFQRAEEMAGKISVRMMLPLMCFVLPSVMIILLGPMLLSSPLFN